MGEDSTDATSQCKAGYYCIGKTVSFDDYDPASPEYRTDGVYSGIADPGYYAPTGSSQQIKCPRGTYTGDPGSESCTSCEAGFFCDALGITKDERLTTYICPLGHYCKSYDYWVQQSETTDNTSPYFGGWIDYQATPCPPGYYNDQTGGSSLDDCDPCPAGYACEEYGTTGQSMMTPCAAGYYCLSGASSRYPDSNDG